MISTIYGVGPAVAEIPPARDEAQHVLIYSLQPKIYAPPPHMPSPTSCLHLNYEVSEQFINHFETIIYHAVKFSDGCAVLYWNRNDERSLVKVLGLLKKYGFNTFIRVGLRVCGGYIDAQLRGKYPQWYAGQAGLMPGIGHGVDTPLYGWQEVGGWREIIKSCMHDMPIQFLSSAQDIFDLGWSFQVYNEPDLVVEWEGNYVPSSLRTCGDRVCAPYYLLGHYICSLSALFVGFFHVGHPSVVYRHGYFHNYPLQQRISFVIPDVTSVNSSEVQEYVFGCLDALHKIPTWLSPRGPVDGTYTALRTIGVVYGVHAYADCTKSIEERKNQILGRIEMVKGAINSWIASRGIPLATPVVVTEFGCGQLIPGATRKDQALTLRAVRENTNAIPFAWWVFAGRKCYNANEGISGRNQPDDWDKMAIVDYTGALCPEE